MVLCVFVQVLCATAVNPATFLTDHSQAVVVAKHVTPPPEGVALEKGRPPVNVGVEGEGSMSLVWIITGVPNLTKVTSSHTHVTQTCRHKRYTYNKYHCVHTYVGLLGGGGGGGGLLIGLCGMHSA